MPPATKKERIKVGSVSIPFYPWSDKSGKQYWRWAWKDGAGKWCYGTRANKADAVEAAAGVRQRRRSELDPVPRGQRGVACDQVTRFVRRAVGKPTCAASSCSCPPLPRIFGS